MTLGTPNSVTSQVLDISGVGGSPPGYWATISLTAEGLNGIASSDPASANNATALNVIRVTVIVESAFTTETIRLDSYRTRWAGNIL